VLGSAECAIGEVQPTGLIDGAEKIGTQAHGSQDVRYIPPGRRLLQLSVEISDVPNRIGVFDPRNPSHAIPSLRSSANRQHNVTGLLLGFDVPGRLDHVLTILNKLGVSSRAQIAAWIAASSPPL
jgi:hypothetical protein